MSVVSEKSPSNPLDNLSVSTKISLGAGLILFFLMEHLKNVILLKVTLLLVKQK